MIKDHNGNYSVGSIVGYVSRETLYGAKIVHEIYVTEIGEYRYVMQGGYVARGSNKFEPYSDGEDLCLVSAKGIKESYGKVWTPEVEVGLKDGDILQASNFKHIFIVRGKLGDKIKLYRISGGAGLFGSYESYTSEYGTLSQVSPGFSDQSRFSDPV